MKQTYKAMKDDTHDFWLVEGPEICFMTPDKLNAEASAARLNVAYEAGYHQCAENEGN